MPLIDVMVRTFIRTVVKRQLSSKMAIETQRRRLDWLGKVPTFSAVTQEWTKLNGVSALKITPKQIENRQSALLYLHGGAFCVGSPISHIDLITRLAVATKRVVWALDYRLAPEHPFPGANEDCLNAYLALTEQYDDIVIAGDSAGGGLSITLTQAIINKDIQMPSAAVVFSPWLDLRCASDSMITRADIDPMVTKDWLTACAEFYCADQTSVDDPTASPLLGKFNNFPRTLIQVGSDEVLYDDAKSLYCQLKEAGIDVELSEYEGMWHVFQMQAQLVSTARVALKEVAQFLNRPRNSL
ncbi:MAG: alpha/beta hydrolase [Oleibacter sp.]|nr:alpha/beta hydrolase [Thalassolituus sp.]